MVNLKQIYAEVDKLDRKKIMDILRPFFFIFLHRKNKKYSLKHD